MSFTPAYFLLLANLFLIGSLIAPLEQSRQICALISVLWFFIGMFLGYKTIT